jgi:murein DD-endopeptidase MepM/ murein hydrolase activator NlpD
MSGVVELLGARWWPRAAALALVAISVAACSGDLSRLHEGPFSSTSSPDATGSVAQTQAAPAAQGEGAPASTQQAGSARRTASASPARPSAKVGTEVAGTPAPASARRATNWSWDGGTAITVARGETLDSIAKRHNVPTAAIMEANNISAPSAIRAGQRLVIPRYKQTQVASAAPISLPAASPSGGAASVHVVAAGDTLGKISHRYGKSVGEIAKANNIDPDGKLNVGDRLVIPGARSSAVSSGSASVVAAKPAVATSEPGPPESASMFASAAPTGKTVTSLAEGTGSLPTFRWPARGRVIASYGPTPNGQQNDGINLALPEGTPVKAAEDGVVAYAGNELKGYGNLVLVRHANGYVTAYAHAKELLVKRGEQVKRGQTIAISGQTGSVNAPQLHFEIRKGASPLDPMRFLNGA